MTLFMIEKRISEKVYGNIFNPLNKKKND